MKDTGVESNLVAGNPSSGTGVRDLVVFSHLRWDHVYQRPQHIMQRSALTHRVFFIEEYKVDSGPHRIESRQVEPNLWVVTPFIIKEERSEILKIPGMLDKFFSEKGIENFIAWYYTPWWLKYTNHLQPALTVYDCMDELSAFNGAPKGLQELEALLLERSDIVFTGGSSLYEAKKDLHDNVHAFPSSIDRDHFAQSQQGQAEPADQADIPKPRLGYFGVIDERMDLELVAAVADKRPDFQLVFIGPVAKLKQEDLPRRPNIHYLGQKSYEDLPAYLAGWDVALLPFAHNRSTRFISPTKIPEYLAGGKPVVSTSIRDVVDPYGTQGLVKIADGVEAFVEAIELTLKEGDAERAIWLQKVNDCLSQNSWDLTWSRMKELIEAALRKTNAGRINDESRKADRLGSSIKQTRLSSIDEDHHRNDDNGGKRRHSGNGRGGRDKPFDFLIVGAGFAGSVLAERLARGSGMRVLIVERRNHIAGNAYDRHDENGLLIHQYGPHIFHTNSREVFAYLSRFTEWRPYEHRVLASVDGQLVPIPINLDTVNQLYGLNLTSLELEKFFESVAEPVANVKTSEDVVISKVGRELYEKFFKNYTRKQWGLDPSELDAQVTSRVPVRMNRDDRYFGDTYQSMPLHGYTRMFENLLDHSNIKVMLNTDFHEVENLIPFQKIIFTGPIDEYFSYAFGRLPYRSLDFKFETLHEERHQPVAVINYPNEHAYTRVTEFKHLTGQIHSKTSLVYEYPCSDGDPYYPIPRAENARLYQRYKALADATPNVYFAGRLGTYRYYNMDQVTAQALNLYAKISGVKRDERITQFTGSTFYADVPCPLLISQVDESA